VEVDTLPTFRGNHYKSKMKSSKFAYSEYERSCGRLKLLREGILAPIAMNENTFGNT
jgi:hypothetical protein